ncbi:MAG: HPr kinase/phosphatase C-terminal domain-containing protein [Pseudomonadota bacterium]
MSETPSPTLLQTSAVAIDGRALMIEGEPGSGKSSLALALIDRGATLIGDDGIEVRRDGNRVLACPPPNIAGLVEIRNVGLVEFEIAPPTPIALILTLSEEAERLPETASPRRILGLEIPQLAFAPGSIAPTPRAEWALRQHGLSFD